MLAPGYLYAALAIAAAIAALHFIVTRQPRAVVLPTARFVPVAAVAATSRSFQLSDWLLLALRTSLALAIGLALSRPVPSPQRERIARLIVADVSGAVQNSREVHDSVRALYRPGDQIVEFDTAARSISAVDSLSRAPRVLGVGAISTALASALHAAPQLRSGADSIELVIVSPFLGGERDHATALLRAQWPGRARLVMVAGAPDSLAAAPSITWPDSPRPPLSVPRTPVDSSGAVVANGNVVIAPFMRKWAFPAESLHTAHVIARWLDGEPAAVERPTANGCERSIAIPVDSGGDLVLRPEFIRLRRILTTRCGVYDLRGRSRDSSMTPMLAGTGPLAAASLFAPPVDVSSPLAPWLLGLAILLALAELLLRRARVRTDKQ